MPSFWSRWQSKRASEVKEEPASSLALKRQSGGDDLTVVVRKRRAGSAPVYGSSRNKSMERRRSAILRSFSLFTGQQQPVKIEPLASDTDSDVASQPSSEEGQMSPVAMDQAMDASPCSDSADVNKIDARASYEEKENRMQTNSDERSNLSEGKSADSKGVRRSKPFWELQLEKQQPAEIVREASAESVDESVGAAVPLTGKAGVSSCSKDDALVVEDCDDADLFQPLAALTRIPLGKLPQGQLGLNADCAPRSMPLLLPVQRPSSMASLAPLSAARVQSLQPPKQPRLSPRHLAPPVVAPRTPALFGEVDSFASSPRTCKLPDPTVVPAVGSSAKAGKLPDPKALPAVTGSRPKSVADQPKQAPQRAGLINPPQQREGRGATVGTEQNGARTRRSPGLRLQWATALVRDVCEYEKADYEGDTTSADDYKRNLRALDVIRRNYAPRRLSFHELIREFDWSDSGGQALSCLPGVNSTNVAAALAMPQTWSQLASR